MDISDDLSVAIRRQWGLVTRAQARSAGVSDAAVRWALGRDWEIVLPGVLHVDRSPLRESQRMLAALLYAGPQAAIAGHGAAWWYGLSHAPPPRLIQVDVPAPARTRTVRWLQVRRTRVPDRRIRERGHLRFVSPDRAVVEAARESGKPAATALVIEAVQRRLVTLDRVAHVNDTLGRRNSAVVSHAIRAAASGAWSIPELGLARLVEASPNLPVMWSNPELETVAGEPLISPDGWFDDVGLAVMVHSQQFHDGPGFDATVERDGELASYDVPVVGLTPRAIERFPEQVLRRVERAYLNAQARATRPAVRVRPRSPWSCPA